MSWTEAKKCFENRLNLAHSHAYRVKKGSQDVFATKRILSKQEIAQQLQKIEKAKQFLAALEELKDSCPNVNERFATEFLETAVKAIATWTDPRPKAPLHHVNLSDFCTKLHPKMLSAGPSPDNNLFNCKLAFGTGALSLAILGIAVMASGPWGLLAVAVAGFVASLVFAAVSGYRLCQNLEVINEQRYEAIVDFVQEFDPKPAKILPVDCSESEEINTATVGCF